MKINTFMMIAALLLIAGLGGMAGFNTTICRQQAELAEDQIERDQLAAEVYWTRLSLRAPPYSLPLEQAWISSGTGYRMDPMGGGTEELHKGVDLAGPIGIPVRSVLAGRVAEHWLVPGWHWGKEYHGDPFLGGKIVLDHGDGLYSIYGHLSATFVHEDDYVEMGQIIGELGNTGISTGSHLHFELVVDPLRYLEGK